MANDYTYFRVRNKYKNLENYVKLFIALSLNLWLKNNIKTYITSGKKRRNIKKKFGIQECQKKIE